MDVSKAFSRKVRLSTWALMFERVWPRVWLLIGVAALFVILSLLGVWSSLSGSAHRVAVALFAATALAAIIYAARAPRPSRDEAVKRIESRSGVKHRPASSYEDQLTAQSSNPDTSALWQAHRQRLVDAIRRLRVGRPSPRADRFDPFAMRSLALLLLIPAALLVSGSYSERLLSAFRFAGDTAGLSTRIDAWVTPPPYTALPPVLLADGENRNLKAADAAKLIEVPEKSLLTLRGLGFGRSGVELEVLADGEKDVQRIAADPPKANDKADLREVRFELRKSARVRALAGSRELGQWTFDVTPDQLPKITFDKPVDRTPRGSMKLSYKAEDDYGVATAEAKVRQAKPKPGDNSKAWARSKPLEGPRLPLERPPVLTLKIPKPGAKTLTASTLLELGPHPWAGQRVELWLEATDAGGNVGKSEVVEIVLPARRFTKPLARAVIEQRRKLAEDSRNRAIVARALDALALEPEGFIEESSVYLGLRSVFHRIERNSSRDAWTESVAQLWQLALKIEDGKLSDAEKALKDTQDKLSKALKDGADEQEIQKLIAELKQKIQDYLKEMQKNAEKDQQGDQNQDEQDQAQELGSNDLDQMMKDLEQNAKEGSREDAEKMLSDLQELLDRLQASTPESRAEQQRSKDMMKKLGQLDDLAGKQQDLMDETFGEQNKLGDQPKGGGQDDPSGQDTPNGKQGKQGKGQKQQQGQQGAQQNQEGGETGEQQSGQESDGDKPGERQKGSQKNGKGDLQQRQGELRKKLEQLKKELNELGVGDPEKLGKAEESMGEAEDALQKKDFEEAAQAQADALKNMRDAGQQMAEQMQKNAQQKLGRGGDTPRDPLGRPQRNEGPDLGNSVKVPDAFEAQRAREILEELRKRSGEAMRPPGELDYIDRLLKRF